MRIKFSIKRLITNSLALSVLFAPISNIDSLIGLNKLQYLSLNSNKITDIKTLSNLQNLKWVDLKLNNVHYINQLSNLIKNDAKVVYKDTDQADFSWWSVVSPKEI
jgi:Leucine-rich repeat (LRR) protein